METAAGDNGVCDFDVQFGRGLWKHVEREKRRLTPREKSFSTFPFTWAPHPAPAHAVSRLTPAESIDGQSSERRDTDSIGRSCQQRTLGQEGDKRKLTVSTRPLHRQASRPASSRCGPFAPAEATRTGRGSGENPPEPTATPAQVARFGPSPLSLSVPDMSLASLVRLRPIVARIPGVTAAGPRSRAANAVARRWHSTHNLCRSPKAFRWHFDFSLSNLHHLQRLDSALNLLTTATESSRWRPPHANLRRGKPSRGQASIPTLGALPSNGPGQGRARKNSHRV